MKTFDQFSTRRDVEELLQDSRLHGEAEALTSVADFIRGGFSLHLVKSNPKRKVFCLANDSGRHLFLKLFAKQKFPFNIIRNYASREYKIAKELEKASVPIISYLLWGKAENSCCFCISEGVPDAVPARKFFFLGLLERNREYQNIFNNSLNEIIRSLHEKHFLHPDFHTGNLICCLQEKRMLLLDPWGIRETFFCAKAAKKSLCSIWMELKDFFSDDEILDHMIASTLCKKKMEALSLLEKAAKIHEKGTLARKAKLHKRVLAGHYRFSTVEKVDGDLYFWRHNLWYAPPEKKEIDPLWEKTIYASQKEAEKWFLHSFDHPMEEKNVVLMIRKNDGTAELYFAKNPCPDALREKYSTSTDFAQGEKHE